MTDVRRCLRPGCGHTNVGHADVDEPGDMAGACRVTDCPCHRYDDDDVVVTGEVVDLADEGDRTLVGIAWFGIVMFSTAGVLFVAAFALAVASVWTRGTIGDQLADTAGLCMLAGVVGLGAGAGAARAVRPGSDAEDPS